MQPEPSGGFLQQAASELGGVAGCSLHRHWVTSQAAGSAGGLSPWRGVRSRAMSGQEGQILDGLVLPSCPGPSPSAARF